MSFFKIKPIWKGNSKHKKLSEDQALQTGKEVIIEPENDTMETENDVVTFELKYFGSTVVDKTSTDHKNVSSEAVKNIIKTAKKRQKDLQRVNVAISTQGINVTDLKGNDLFKVSIFRISNCASDSTHRQFFSFIATDENDTTECHAFFCFKRKTAEAVTLAVGKIFTSAYENWRDMPHIEQMQKSPDKPAVEEVKVEDIGVKENLGKSRVVSEEKLIDFDNEVEEDDWEFDELCMTRNVSNNSQWVSFEDEFSPVSVQMPPQKNLILV
ncbi:low density lipoprotein receptor adapter protein 1-like isoform X2 [Sitophilus oryzae]|uniref:Low density lipoprotein receptor adapter protein 1-like isoform X2 n=1 Tax=Sitophilus oryzae TaxID=7048 RepID=A0A6J2XRU8_SITOR|nr:low density lipoprotein receptor adapter protein 1-like isoform X2 [Sitophilus oryzae]